MPVPAKQDSDVKRPYVDFLVIIPLEEEMTAFLEVFPGGADKSTDTSFRYFVDIPESRVSILAVLQSDMGRMSALETSAEALSFYDAGVLVSLGIAGSLSNDLRLGDVCYSGNVLDVLDNAKASDGKEGDVALMFSPTYYSTPLELAAALGFMRLSPELSPRFAQWQADRETAAKSLITAPVLDREGQSETIAKPKSLRGNIVCGAVTRSEKYNERLAGLDRRILAIDTESGGIFRVAENHNLPALTIRGASDYANKGKSQLEKTSEGSVRKLAAANAATFLKLQLSNPNVQRYLSGRRLGNQGTPALPGLEPSSAENELLALVGTLGSICDAWLRKLSPQFRSQPKGSRLPMPRIKQINVPDSVEQGEAGRPTEVRNALKGKRAIVVHIPSTYPDQSLPWVMALDLLGDDSGDKELLPVVLDGSHLGPPKSGFQELATLHEVDLRNPLPGTQPLLIIDNPPFHSKSRIAFILKQAEEYPDVKLIFITRGEPSTTATSDLVVQLAADVYRITDISFSEITKFIARHFEMSGAEADVIALRLRNTFSRFALSAHPTYFAGIPRETLSALLQANRRAELIQLAVDGFLTFLVADDSADVQLSRSTRARFLRQVAVQIRVEKKSFTEAELIEFTAAFAKKYDFDIKPIAFVQAFIDKGILHFANDRAQFSLPFIESYLLAAELHANPDQAEQYFRLDTTPYDYSTFDLYAEIGAAPALVSKIVETVAKRVDGLDVPDDHHVLLDDEIRLPLLAKPERFLGLQRELGRAIAQVRSNDSNAEEKQILLDITDQIRENTAKRSRTASHATTDSAETDQLNASIQAWNIGTILIGAGAEHLDAPTKRQLATNLVNLGSHFVDGFTKYLLKAINFGALKEELTSEKALNALAANSKGEADLTELKRTTANLIDLFELIVISSPLRRLLHQLIENCRHRVLATSIEKSEANGAVAKVIRALWLFDLNVKDGRPAFDEALKDLPLAPFLRLVIATHLLNRVYWSHADQNAREALLDAAFESIKPISIKVDKGRILRGLDEQQK